MSVATLDIGLTATGYCIAALRVDLTITIYNETGYLKLRFIYER